MMFYLRKTIGKRLSIILFLCIAVLFNASSVFSAEVTLSWNHPVTNTDGTELTDLAGFIIYYGTASGDYSYSIDAGNSKAYKVESLAERTTYYFAVTAYNASLNESGYSNEVAYYVNQSIIAAQTCEGQCGMQSQSGCWCDANCIENGDCCEDYESICSSPQTEDPGENVDIGYYEKGCFGTGADCPAYLGIYADLYQCDLNNANLVMFELKGACLNGAVLTNANLYGTSFVNADLSNADLRGAYMSYADLSGANLSNAYLRGAYMRYADLSGANLSKADLGGAYMRYADLSGANLSNAYLNNTSLVYADLRGADLNNTSLVYADLRGAYMSFADLTDANLTNARLQVAELDKVIWLNTICPDGSNSSYNGSNSCIGHL